MIFFKTLKGFRVASLEVLVFCALIISYPVVAQNAVGVATSIQYKATSWGTHDGLPNTLITLCLTKNEFLWTGGYDGLFRFDGNKFDVFNKFNTKAIKSNRITALEEDSDENLWIGTGLGLVIYKRGQFINCAGKFDFYIESLCIDKSNRHLWIGTRGDGLFEYDIEHDRYKKIEKFPSDLINSIVRDSLEGIWVGSDKYGLAHIKNQDLKYYGKSEGLSSTEILYLNTDATGTLYVCTSSGLFKKQGDKFIAYPEFNGLRVKNAKKDFNGNLWVATTSGVYKQNADGTWSHFTTREGLSNNDVQDICFDSEGSIWLSTYRGGLNQLRATQFNTISQNQGLVTEGVGDIHEVSKNKFIIGTTDGKLYRIDDGLVKPFVVKTKFTERVYDILRDDKSNLWIASYGGLLLITPDGRERLFTERDGLPTKQLRIIYQDRQRRYWIGTRNRGLIKMEIKGSPLNARFDLFKYDELNRLHSTFIMSMEEDAKGNFLIGSDTGGMLVIEADGTIHHYGKEEGNVNTVTLSAHFDNDGIIWMATTEGICMMTNGTFFNFDQDDGLYAGNIFDIVADDQGYFWLTSAREIIRVKKQQLIDYRNKKINHIDWKIYDSNNELENSFSTAPSHILKATDGSIWFPMKRGVVVANTNSIIANTKKPTVYIEKVNIDDKEFISSERLVIPAGNQRVVFSYTAISLHYPNTAKYKYQLQPFDHDWNDASKGRQAIYTNLPTGNYTFKVIACNNDGMWNTTGASISIFKEPYFYETWWFSGLVVASFIFSTIMLVRWRTKEAKAKAIKLEKEVDKRTLQLKEESREKTAMINIVAHDLKAPLSKIKGLVGLMKMTSTFSKEQQEYVSYIDQSILQGDQLIRDLLDIHSFEHEDSKLELGEINLRQVLNQWQQTINGQLHQKNQILESTIEVTESLTIFTDHHKLVRILDNLLTNASKFSEKEKNIHFKVWQTGEFINYSIRDEGPGISEEDQKKLFKRFQKLTARPTAGENSSGLGLSIIKVLVEKLRGSISVNSKLGEGAEFIVSLPINPLEIKK